MTRTERSEPLYCPYLESSYYGKLVNTDPSGQCEHAGRCRFEIPCAWDDTEPGAKKEEKEETP